MNKIEELHLDAINSEVYVDQRKYDDHFVADVDKAASKSAEITQQIAIEFATWCAENYVPTKGMKELKYWQKGSYRNKADFYSTWELFQIFKKDKIK